jgi:putative transcriptional regulator
MITNQWEWGELDIEAERSKATPPNEIHAPIANEVVEVSARQDRDAQPLTESNVNRTKDAPQTKFIRRALKLTQEEFAARYHIPLGTLRDWEQGRSEPDQATRAYLIVIARDPDHVNHVLNQPPEKPGRLEPGTVSVAGDELSK